MRKDSNESGGGKNYFRRKNRNCTQVNYLLCKEQYKIVDSKKQEFEEEYGQPLSWTAAINMIILEYGRSGKVQSVPQNLTI